MSAKAIHEADGKAILSYHLTRSPAIAPTPLPKPAHNAPPKLASIVFAEDSSVDAVLQAAEQTYPWLTEAGAKFVAKPDQLIKRRGKAGLLALNKSWPDAKAWIAERAGKQIQVEHVKGYLRTFLVEPFCPHKPEEEYYINIHSVREVSGLVFLSRRMVLSLFAVLGARWERQRKCTSFYMGSRLGRAEASLAPRSNRNFVPKHATLRPLQHHAFVS